MRRELKRNHFIKAELTCSRRPLAVFCRPEYLQHPVGEKDGLIDAQFQNRSYIEYRLGMFEGRMQKSGEKEMKPGISKFLIRGEPDNFPNQLPQYAGTLAPEVKFSYVGGALTRF